MDSIFRFLVHEEKAEEDAAMSDFKITHSHEKYFKREQQKSCLNIDRKKLVSGASADLFMFRAMTILAVNSSSSSNMQKLQRLYNFSHFIWWIRAWGTY